MRRSFVLPCRVRKATKAASRFVVAVVGDQLERRRVGAHRAAVDDDDRSESSMTSASAWFDIRMQVPASRSRFSSSRSARTENTSSPRVGSSRMRLRGECTIARASARPSFVRRGSSPLRTGCAGCRAPTARARGRRLGEASAAQAVQRAREPHLLVHLEPRIEAEVVVQHADAGAGLDALAAHLDAVDRHATAVGARAPTIMRNVVVLPEPLPPSSVVIAPSSALKSMPSTATVAAKHFWSSVTTIISAVLRCGNDEARRLRSALEAGVIAGAGLRIREERADESKQCRRPSCSCESRRAKSHARASRIARARASPSDGGVTGSALRPKSRAQALSRGDGCEHLRRQLHVRPFGAELARSRGSTSRARSLRRGSRDRRARSVQDPRCRRYRA